MLECKSSLGETVKTKSADQILEELFTTLVKAPSDVEPPPPGDELPPISHQVTKIEEGVLFSIQVLKIAMAKNCDHHPFGCVPWSFCVSVLIKGSAKQLSFHTTQY